MSESSSILDKVMEVQQTQGLEMPEDLLRRVIASTLSEREKDILHLRFGLGQKVHTLDAIGKKFFITRERVRQITKQAITKLTKIKGEIDELKQLDKQLKDILDVAGGMRSHVAMARDFYGTKPSQDQLAVLKFVANHLSDYLEPSKVGEGWQLVGTSTDLHDELTKVVKEHLTELKDPHTIEALHDKLSDHNGFNSWQKNFLNENSREHADIDWHKVLASYLDLADEIKQNPFEEWGLKTWASVNPRRISDKIYLVLKRHGKPLHFEDITSKINEFAFDSKKAHAPTVHNELILNKSFVLIGRGIYVLKEWGYTSGTVADVLEKVLKNADGPMQKEDLLSEVLEQRRVKEGTVYLALNDRERFDRDSEGKYFLVTSPPVADEDQLSSEELTS